MSWEPELGELERLRRLRARMGGPEAIARQHAQGRLTVRERVDLLVDENSFQETSTIAGAAKWDDEGRLESFRPVAYVNGLATIDGRPVIIEGGDFTIRGGSADSGTPYPRVDVSRMAGELRMPFIRLLDGAGGSVRNYDPEARRGGGDAPPGHAAADESPLVEVKVTGTPAGSTCRAGTTSARWRPWWRITSPAGWPRATSWPRFRWWPRCWARWPACRRCMWARPTSR